MCKAELQLWGADTMSNEKFQVGGLVFNGQRAARIVGLIADDALEVLYEGDDETTIEVASYFRKEVR